jgi:hypothetical protein
MSTDTIRDIINDSNRPEIEIVKGELATMADRAQEILAAAHERTRIYERGGILVQAGPAEKADAKTKNLIRRPRQAMVLTRVTPTILEDWLNRLIAWTKTKIRANEPVDVVDDCTERIPHIIASRRTRAGQHRLLNVIEAPILLADGRIVDKPGYDDESGLLLDSTEKWIAVPRKLTLEDAKAAAAVLLQPFAEFPFASDADKSVLLSAILTALQRRTLDLAPLHANDAPNPSTGKTLLADCVSLIATGRPATCISDPMNEVEWRKLITTLLVAGDAVVLIDNVRLGLNSATLAKTLTALQHSDRLLGATIRVTPPTNVMWLASGNNIEFGGDMPSRVLVCRIDAEDEHPEKRTFAISDLRGHILDHRPELVRAALTILRAHYVAGRPSTDLEPTRFPQWDHEIRAAIVWLGYEDPAKTRVRIDQNDPERESIGRVLACWNANPTLKNRLFPVSKVIKEAKEDPNDPDFRDALIEIAEDREAPGKISPLRLGNWCRSHQGQIVSGLRLKKADRENSKVGAPVAGGNRSKGWFGRL